MSEHMSNEQKVAEAVLALHAAFAVLVDALPYTSLVGGQQAQRDVALYANGAHRLITAALRSMTGLTPDVDAAIDTDDEEVA